MARLGGDEFAVVVPEAGVKAMELARRLLGALHGPVEVDGVAVTVRASAGLVSAPGDGSDVGTLLRRAELAMYSAKGRDSRFTELRRRRPGSGAAPPARWPAPRRPGRLRRCRCTTSPPSS